MQPLRRSLFAIQNKSLTILLICIGALLLAPMQTARADNPAQGCVGEGCGTPIEDRDCHGPDCASGEPPQPGGDGDSAAGGELAIPPGPAGRSGDDGKKGFVEFVKFLVGIIMDSAIGMVTTGLKQAIGVTATSYASALHNIIFGSYGIAGDGGAISVRPAWNVMFTIAMLLLPATLALTAVSAMRTGAASVLGYADLKEALINWFIAAGVAAASLYLIGLAQRLSHAATLAVLTADFNAAHLSAAVFNVMFWESVAFLALPGIVQLYLIFFALFLAITVILSLGLALAAYTALFYILSVLAPLVIVLGALPPFRWLHFLWGKALTITFLLPVIDALLLRAASTIYHNIHAGAAQGLAEFIAGVFITAGLMSMLIAINYKVGEIVFGALGEVHRRALGATKAVAGMALSVAGAAAGVAVGGAAAGAMGGQVGGALGRTGGGSPGGPGGSGGSDGTTALASGEARNARSTNGRAAASGASPATTLASDPQLRQRTAQYVSRAGQALAMGSRNPFSRGFGLGAMVGGARDGMQAGIELDAQRAAAQQDRDYDRMLAPAYKNNNYPPELSRPHFEGGERSAQGLLGRHLQRNVPEAPRAAAENLNTRLYSAMRNATGRQDSPSTSSGQAQALVDARQGLYAAYSSGNTDPSALRGELAVWSRAHNVPLPSGWERDVDALYPAAQLQTPPLPTTVPATPSASAGQALNAAQIRARVQANQGGQNTP